MNLFVAVAFLAFGELANLLLVSLSVCSILGGNCSEMGRI